MRNLSSLVLRLSSLRTAPADRGASLVEYALLMALIAVVCFAAMQFFGSSLSGRYSGVASSLV